MGEVIGLVLAKGVKLVALHAHELGPTSSIAHLISSDSIRYIGGTTWGGMLISLSLKIKPTCWRDRRERSVDCNSGAACDLAKIYSMSDLMAGLS